jgi:hypothetical protein
MKANITLIGGTIVWCRWAMKANITLNGTAYRRP